MADTIKCPVCGEVNAADNEFCQNCRSRLQPLTGPLKGEGKAIQPGDAPTQKVTAELEPILPQWLRDARAKARKTAEDEAIKASEEPPTAPAAKPDLLAGLASQARDDEEELPDWAAGIAGVQPSKKKKPDPRGNQVRWVELGSNYVEPDTSPIGATQAPAESTDEHIAPTWMPSQGPAPERDELTDFPAWPPAQGETPSITSGTLEYNPEPGWQDQPDTFQPPQAARGEAADWMADLPAQSSVEPPPAAPLETPDWMARLKEQTPEEAPPTQAKPSQSQPAADVPDWLKSLDSGQQSAAPAASQVPDWLKGIESEPTPPAAAEPPLPTFLKEAPPTGAEAPSPAEQLPQTPDWLTSLGSAPQVPEEPIPPAPTFQKVSFPASDPVPSPAEQSPEAPDWLASLGSVPPAPAEPAPPIFAAQTFSAPEEASPQESPEAPAFSQDALSGSDVDSLFASMQIPDWLSSAVPETPKSAQSDLPPAAQSADLSPAELPSWVQAMRPVESGVPGAASDPTLETRGPLAGLHGVLPVMPMGPTSKPKSHSIKLDASQEQQAHAQLLEQILASEAAPAPIKSTTAVRSQRLLRWGLAGLLFTAVFVPLLAGTQIFALPLTAGPEIGSALQMIQAVPPAAPVLVIYDVDPSLSGELEAVAAPLLDQMILLRQPRLTFLSSSPTGAALAEHLISQTLSGHNYQRGFNYQNLGFLPGGLAGVLAFAGDPPAALPLAPDLTLPWGTPPLLGVTRLSDFAAILIVTDSAETARVWIEQTGTYRGASPLMVIASAQAGPLIMPYYASGQVGGLVSGLNGGALVEQANSGRPGLVRRYWDAYSLGLLLAAGLITVGGLWNLMLGLGARGRTRAEGLDVS